MFECIHICERGGGKRVSKKGLENSRVVRVDEFRLRRKVLCFGSPCRGSCMRYLICRAGNPMRFWCTAIFGSEA